MRLASRVALVCVVVSIAFFSTACVTNMFPGGPTPAGGIVTNVKGPAQNLAVATDANADGSMKGESSSCAVLGLFAFGDGSVDKAMKDGGLTKVHHVDHQVFSILWGLYLQNKTIVYGE